MERIATDTSSFEDLRNGGFVYVDKTAILKRLTDGSIGKQFFIARPRRFGTSLAVSTLQRLFANIPANITVKREKYYQMRNLSDRASEVA